MSTLNNSQAPIRPTIEHYDYAKQMKRTTAIGKLGISTLVPIPFVQWMFGANVFSTATSLLPENSSWTSFLGGSTVSSLLGKNDSAFGVICQLVPFFLQTPYFFAPPNEPTMGQKLTILSHYPTKIDENGDTVPIPLEEARGLKSGASSIWRSEIESRWDKFYILPTEFYKYFSQNRIIDFVAGPLAQKLWIIPELKMVRQFTPGAISDKIEEKIEEVATQVKSLAPLQKLHSEKQEELFNIKRPVGVFSALKKDINVTPKLIAKIALVATAVLVISTVTLAVGIATLPTLLITGVILYFFESKHHFIAKGLMNLVKTIEGEVFDHIYNNCLQLFGTKENFYAILNGVTDSMQRYIDLNQELAKTDRVQELHGQIEQDIKEYQQVYDALKKTPSSDLTIQLRNVKARLEQHKNQLQNEIVYNLSKNKAKNLAEYKAQVKAKIANVLPKILLKDYEKRFPKSAFVIHKIVEEFKQKNPQSGPEALYQFIADKIVQYMPDFSTMQLLPDQIASFLDPASQMTKVKQLELEIELQREIKELHELQSLELSQQKRLELLELHLHELKQITELQNLEIKPELSKQDCKRCEELRSAINHFAIVKEHMKSKESSQQESIEGKFNIHEIAQLKQQEIDTLLSGTEKSIASQIKEIQVAQEILQFSKQPPESEEQTQHLQNISIQLASMPLAQEYIDLKVKKDSELTKEDKLRLEQLEKIGELAMKKALGSMADGAQTLLTTEAKQMMQIASAHSDPMTYYVLDNLLDTLEKISEGKLEHTTHDTPTTPMNQLVEELEELEANLKIKQNELSSSYISTINSRPELYSYYKEKENKIKSDISILEAKLKEKKEQLEKYKYNKAYYQYQQLHIQKIEAEKELPEVIAQEKTLMEQKHELEHPSTGIAATIGWGLNKFAEMTKLKSKEKPVSEQIREIEVKLSSVKEQRKQLESLIELYPENKRLLMQDLQTYEASFERKTKKLMHSVLDLISSNSEKLIDEQQLPNTAKLADMFNGDFNDPNGAGQLKSMFLRMNHQGDWFVNLAFGGLVHLASKVPQIQGKALQLGFKIAKDEIIPQLPVAEGIKIAYNSMQHILALDSDRELKQLQLIYQKVQLETQVLEEKAQKLADKIRQVRDEKPKTSLNMSMQMDTTFMQGTTTAYDELQLELKDKKAKVQKLGTNETKNEQERIALNKQIEELTRHLENYPYNYLDYLELEYRRIILQINMKLASLEGMRRRASKQISKA